MLCEDINGLVVKIGNLNSYYGHVGDELPITTENSYYI